MLTLAFLVLACATPEPVAAPVPTPAPAPEAAAPAAEPSAPAVFLGDAVDPAGALAIDEVIARSTEFDGKEIVVRGTVKEVCQKKGCWHTIATANPDVAVMAKDKDYKIFLPKDSAGKAVLVKGTFAVAEVPEAEARHYAEDAGKDPATIVGPQKGFQLDVAGVQFVEG